MNHTFFRAFSASILTYAALFAAAPAHAALVDYDFVVTIDTAGALQGQSFSGNFSFDDAQVPGTGIGGEDLFALSAFSFSFDGNSYSLATLDYGDAAFDAGQLLGLDAGAPNFSFLPASGPFAASFAYDFGANNAGNGSTSFTLANANNNVPEPATVLLLVVGLLAAGALRTVKAGAVGHDDAELA